MLYNNKSDKSEQNIQSDTEPVDTKTECKISWKVEGMDCASCAQKIEQQVRSLADVTDAKIIFSTEKLVVTTKAGENAKNRIENAVKSIGYNLMDEDKQTYQEHHHGLNKQELYYPLFMLLIMLSSFAISFFSPDYSQYGFVIATVIGLIPILEKAWLSIHNKNVFAIETLMSISAIGALFIGAAEEAAMVLLLFMVGEFLEAFSAARARKGVKSLMALMPETTTIIKNGERLTVASNTLKPGDIIEVSAGGRLPADAELLSDDVSIDESALTGESIPVEHNIGDRVPAGGLVIEQTIQLTVVSEPGDNAIDRILHLIEEAESQKAPIERFIDKFSRYYTPCIVLVALLVVILPPVFFSQPWETWIYRGLTLLLIGCPCALIISTPASITSALASGAHQGVLIKGGAVLEALAKIKVIAIDKTGTLTLGKPHVTDIIPYIPELGEKAVLGYAAAIEAGSNHPLAKAIVEKTTQLAIKLPIATQVKAIAGVGIHGIINQEYIQIGAPNKLPDIALSAQNRRDISQLENEGKTVVIVLKANQVIGLIALQDTLRQGSQQAINKLNQIGVRTVMLTGDNQQAAAAIAKELDMDYRAQLLPVDKVREIQLINQQSPTAMVGDGINDAPAMKMATVGIAMGNGTDVALETADAALMNENLNGIVKMITLSRAANNNIRQNITVALGLKAIFLITSILGLTGLWMAVLADSGATAIVTLNALRLLRHKE